MCSGTISRIAYEPRGGSRQKFILWTIVCVCVWGGGRLCAAFSKVGLWSFFFLQKIEVGSLELEQGLKKWVSRAKTWTEKALGLKGDTSPYHLNVNTPRGYPPAYRQVYQVSRLCDHFSDEFERHQLPLFVFALCAGTQFSFLSFFLFFFNSLIEMIFFYI